MCREIRSPIGEWLRFTALKRSSRLASSGGSCYQSWQHSSHISSSNINDNDNDNDNYNLTLLIKQTS